jgi:hypothetical protein
MDFDYPFGISTLLTLPEHLSSTPVFVGFMVLDRSILLVGLKFKGF